MSRSATDVSTEVDVGERLRTLRQFRRYTLQSVAARSGISESFLSQVERGRSNASIASLKRIADALGVSMADLFEPERHCLRHDPVHVQRRGPRLRQAVGHVGRRDDPCLT